MTNPLPDTEELYRARNCAHWLADAVCAALAVRTATDRRAFDGYLAVAQNRLDDIADALGGGDAIPSPAASVIYEDFGGQTVMRKAHPAAEPTVTLADAVNVWKASSTAP